MHLSCLVSSCLVLTSLVLSCVTLVCVCLFVCLFVCICLSVCLSVYLCVRSFVRSCGCVLDNLCVFVCVFVFVLVESGERGREGEKGYEFIFCLRCCVLCVVFGSGWSTVARLKLEGIDGKAPSRAEPAACEPAACERPVVVCVGREGGRRGNGCLHRSRLRVYVQNVRVCTGTKPTFFIHVGLVPVHTRTF